MVRRLFDPTGIRVELKVGVAKVRLYASRMVVGSSNRGGAPKGGVSGEMGRVDSFDIWTCFIA